MNGCCLPSQRRGAAHDHGAAGAQRNSERDYTCTRHAQPVAWADRSQIKVHSVLRRTDSPSKPRDAASRRSVPHGGGPRRPARPRACSRPDRRRPCRRRRRRPPLVRAGPSWQPRYCSKTRSVQNEGFASRARPVFGMPVGVTLPCASLPRPPARPPARAHTRRCATVLRWCARAPAGSHAIPVKRDLCKTRGREPRPPRFWHASGSVIATRVIAPPARPPTPPTPGRSRPS